MGKKNIIFNLIDLGSKSALSSSALLTNNNTLNSTVGSIGPSSSRNKDPRKRKLHSRSGLG